MSETVVARLRRRVDALLDEREDLRDQLAKLRAELARERLRTGRCVVCGVAATQLTCPAHRGVLTEIEAGS